MKIGIDARLWNQTGVGRYVRNICVNLQRIDKKNSYVLFVRNEDEKDAREVINSENWKIVKTNSRWHSISEQIKFPRRIKKEKVDLMHFPYFSVPLFYKDPFIVTIHDLILHHHASGEASTLPVWLYGFKMLNYRLVINNAGRRAKKIIAVSKSTKNEIADHLMVNKANIEVIYEAADDFKAESDEKVNINNYFLFVGNVYPHKNVDLMIKAFKKVSEKNNVKLVFVGKEDFFYEKLKKQVKKLVSSGKIIFVNNASDKALSAYYRNAICLIRPSLMEGFSLPPLEAMANNCLVLASDIPVHKEIFADAIIYFNPKDYVDMEEKMESVLSLPGIKKEEYIKKGKEIVRQFSWEKAARQTLEIYESCIGI